MSPFIICFRHCIRIPIYTKPKWPPEPDPNPLRRDPIDFRPLEVLDRDGKEVSLENRHDLTQVVSMLSMAAQLTDRDLAQHLGTAIMEAGNRVADKANLELKFDTAGR